MKLAALVAVIAIILTVLIVRLQAVDYEEFMKDSYKATAQITTKREMVADQKTQRKEMRIEYRYMANGRVYTGNESVEFTDLWDPYTPGQTVEVYISSKDAGQSYLAEPITRRLKMARKGAN